MNPAAGAALWRLSLETEDADAAAAAVLALEADGAAVSAFQLAPGGAWRIDALSVSPPECALVEARLALAWSGQAGAPPPLSLERVAARDWVSENQASFTPIRAGRFVVHGARHRDRVPRNAIRLLIEAATAFGTGEHGSTRGCLLALDRVARRLKRRPRVLDMGSGTGVLAIAAAKIFRRKVWASDIDAEAARVTRVNARLNGVARLIAARQCGGYRRRALRRAGPYDLILANILARPLARMAPDLARALAPRGLAVLAGLLPRQEAFVLAAHRAAGLHLVARATIEGWRTLVLARGFAPFALSPHQQSDSR